MSFAKHISNTHIRLEVDNTTTVSYINNQGGRAPHLYLIALQTWQFAIDRNIWLSAAHIPGVLNVEADAASRADHKYDKEWQLAPDLFAQIQSEIGPNDIDMFATRINAQLPSYVAWLPDPGASAIDAFTLDWSMFNAFFFPPFSLIGRTVHKILADRATGTVVAPIWPTQPWYTDLLRISRGTPRLLRHHHILRLPHKPEASHPLLPKMRLAAFAVSATHSPHRESPLTPPSSFWPLGA
jgi:hypothetical protein